MAHISYNMVMDVTTSWDRLKQIPNYESIAGEIIFLRVFDIEPAAREMFKYSVDENIKENPTFASHSRMMIQMIDDAVAFLGPDLEPLEPILAELGRRHVGYGVKPKYLPIMKQAVDHALRTVLGNNYTTKESKSWQTILDYMVTKMKAGMKSRLARSISSDSIDTWDAYGEIVYSKDEITYGHVMDVTTSWDNLKSVPDYENIAGQLIFERVFKIQPAARAMFKYTKDEDIRSNPTFAIHSRMMIKMIDCAVNFLGPDLDPLEYDLQELGKRHIRYGVKPEYLPVMKRAVHHALKNVLGKKYTNKQKRSWAIILNFMVTNMQQGMKELIVELTKKVTKSWNALKQVDGYENVAGKIIYQNLFALEPAAKELFNKQKDMCENQFFSSHSRAIIGMLDGAVSMLGPDLTLLSDSLIRLGVRHVKYGVQPDYLPFMGKALDSALTEVLGEKYTQSDKKSWEIVLDFMVSKMTVGML